MSCPICKHEHTTVDFATRRPDHIRRRRLCPKCGHRWHTCEYTEEQLEEQIRLAEQAKAYAAAVLDRG